MVDNGNPNSITDAGVGSLCVMAAIEGAGMNVKVNGKDLTDRQRAIELQTEADDILSKARAAHDQIIQIVNEALEY